MPEYEYECDYCHKHAEYDSPAAGGCCPHCGKGNMHRVYSAPAVLWQGGKPSAEGGDEQ